MLFAALLLVTWSSCLQWRLAWWTRCRTISLMLLWKHSSMNTLMYIIRIRHSGKSMELMIGIM